MSVTLHDLVAETKKNKFSISNSLSDDDVISVWDNVSEYISKQMTQSKGVSIPGFGVFSFSNKKIDVGSNKYILLQRPVLQISEKLAKTHGINYTKYHISGDVPVVPLNYSALSQLGPFDRDSVEASVRDLIQAISRALAANKNIEVSFNGIGKLSIRETKLKMQFFKTFINSIDSTGKLIPALKDRPGTVDSVLSDGVLSRPGTKNSFVLPRIKPASSIEGNRSMSPIREEINSLDQLKAEEPLGTQEDYDPIIKTSDNVMTTGEVEMTEPIDVVEEFGDLGVTSYDGSNMTKPQDGDDIMAEIKQIKRMIEEETDGDPQLPSNGLRTESRLSMPLAKADCMSLHHIITPASSRLSKSSPRLIRRSLSPLQTVRESAQKLNHPPYELNEKSSSAPARNASSMSCGHINSGQELCYLCHQRDRLNIPVSFEEERKKREEEQDRVSLEYQKLKDAEAIMKQREKEMQKRYDNQRMAAFNLGVAEAVNSLKNSRSLDFHPSYVFQKRPLTPPKVIKQQQYYNDLAGQVDYKDKVTKNKKEDEKFLECLEQVQLAEDLAAQRQQTVKDKSDQQEQYRQALSAQVKFKPLPMPAMLPDNKYFGQNDMTNDLMMQKRRRAHNLYKDQIGVVEQRKRDAILQRINDQKEETEMLKRTKDDLLQDRADRFIRMYNTRRTLENNWTKALEMKKKREEEEKEFGNLPSNLVHEQCDKYKRCGQCKRRLHNCGESNIWRDSRYIPGSRLIV